MSSQKDTIMDLKNNLFESAADFHLTLTSQNFVLAQENSEFRSASHYD